MLYSMLISSYSIPEFVALRYARTLSGKTIGKAKKRIYVAVNGILFTKSVSNKFKTMQKINCSM